MKIHINCFITEDRQQVGSNLSLVQLNRLSVFLLMLISINKIGKFNGLISAEVDNRCFNEMQQEYISKSVQILFPDVKYSPKRATSIEDWRYTRQFLNLKPDELIFHSGNDDHIFIASDPNNFLDYITSINLSQNPRTFFSVSHWHELIQKRAGFIKTNKYSDTISPYFFRDAICVTSGLLFNEWISDAITSHRYIRRLDEVEWESRIPFELTVPRIELFRHFDGYQGAGIHLSPLLSNVERERLNLSVMSGKDVTDILDLHSEVDVTETDSFELHTSSDFGATLYLDRHFSHTKNNKLTTHISPQKFRKIEQYRRSNQSMRICSQTGIKSRVCLIILLKHPHFYSRRRMFEKPNRSMLSFNKLFGLEIFNSIAVLQFQARYTATSFLGGHLQGIEADILSKVCFHAWGFFDGFPDKTLLLEEALEKIDAEIVVVYEPGWGGNVDNFQVNALNFVNPLPSVFTADVEYLLPNASPTKNRAILVSKKDELLNILDNQFILDTESIASHALDSFGQVNSPLKLQPVELGTVFSVKEIKYQYWGSLTVGRY